MTSSTTLSRETDAVPTTTEDAADTAAVLSICIPTYNRSAFLDYLLRHFASQYTFDFTIEIVISDNASTDDTADVVTRYREAGLPISYYRQEFNKGSLANLFTALHRARGRYVMYLADDDLVEPVALSEAIAFLQAHPQVRAAYAPWELYDDVNKVGRGTFYTLEREQIFEPGDEIDLLTLIVDRHIFPETVIYRNDTVHDVILDARFCFWAFSYLANVLARGPVAFLPKVYYRSVTLSSVAPNRGQAGLDQAMTDWDNYRGGLEYFIYVLLRRSGRPLPAEAKQQLRDAIDGFIATRMRVAMRLWLGRRDFVRVYELACRLNYLDPAGVAAVPRINELPLLVAVQTLARLANSIAELERVVLVGASDPPSLESLLREVGLDARLAVTTPSSVPLDEGPHNSLVFLVDETDRPKFLRLGYEPGLIISERELMSGIHLG